MRIQCQKRNDLSISIVGQFYHNFWYILPMQQQQQLSRAERQRLQLQADILQAAFTEFSERGYHQTSVADIAQSVGIGHGTFYRHFANKRDILHHVIVDTTQQLMALLNGENAPQSFNTIEEYQEQCQRISIRFREFATQNPSTLKLLLLEATSIDAEMTLMIQNLIQMAGLFTANYLQHGVELGLFRSNLDCLNTGHNIVGMIINGALRFLSQPDEVQALEDYANSIIQLIIAGMRA